MTAGLCPSCLKNYSSLEKHFSRSYFCNPGIKKANDPTSGKAFVAEKEEENEEEEADNYSVGDDTNHVTNKRKSKRARRSFASNPGAGSSLRREPPAARPASFSSRLDDYISEYRLNSDFKPGARSMAEHDSEEEEEDRSSWRFELPDIVMQQATNAFISGGAVEDDASVLVGSTAAAAAMPTDTSVIPTSSDAPQDTADNTISELIGQDIHFPIELQDSLSLVANNWDRSMAELYSVADRSGAPRGLIDELLTVMRREREVRQFSPFNPSITKRDAFFQRMAKQSDYQAAEKILVTLESGQRVTVNRFKYIEDLKEKLVSEVYADCRNNVRCDQAKPFSNLPPPLDPEQPPHLLDYSFYKDTYTDIFLPSLDGADERNHHCFLVTGNSDATSRSLRSIEPVAIVDSRLTDKAQADVANWIVLGYMPHIEKISAAMRKGFSSRGSAEDIMARDYHRCMSVILQPLLQFSQTKPVVKVRRGEIIRPMRMHTHFAMWTLDNKAADICCAKNGAKGPGSKRMTRRCLCTFEDAEASHHVCFPVNGGVIESLSQAALGPTYGLYTTTNQAPERDDPGVKRILQARYGKRLEEIVGQSSTSPLHLPSIALSINVEHWLSFVEASGTPAKRGLAVRCRKLRQTCAARVLKKVLGTKVVDNAFSQFSYGANANGINAATTADVLHVMKNGIFPKFTTAFYHPMTPTQLSMIDLYVEKTFCHGHNRGSERERLPRVSFKKGYTKLTELSGAERVGQLYVMAYLLRTKRGRELLSPRIETDFDTKRKTLSDRARKRGGFSNLTHGYDYHSDSSSLSGEEEEDDEDSEDEVDGDETNFEEADSAGDDVISWSTKNCLEYLRLDVIQDLRKTGSLPKSSAAKLEEVLSDFLSPNVVKHLIKSSLEVGPLPASSRLEYRACPEYLRKGMESHSRPATISPVLAFPASSTVFRTNADRSGNSVKLDLDELSYLVESLLTYWAFVEYAPTSSMTTDKIARASRCLELLRRVLVKGVKRDGTSYGWAFQKFLEMYHILIETPLYGRGSGKDTNHTENHLKTWAVKPAKTAQKRDDATFTGQISQRYAESGVLDKIIRSNRIQHPVIESKQDTTLRGRGRYNLDIINGGETHLYYAKNRKNRLSFEVDQAVTEHLLNQFEEYFDLSDDSDHDDGSSCTSSYLIAMWTEIRVFGAGQGVVLYRAHPNYDGKGPWYDSFLLPNGRPARIVAFYSDPTSPSLEPTHMVVQEAMPQSQKEKGNDSQLFTQWRWRCVHQIGSNTYGPVLKSYRIEEIGKGVCCIDIHPRRGSLGRIEKHEFSFLVAVDQRDEWCNKFLESTEYLTKKMQML